MNRFRLGDEIPIEFQVRSIDGVPENPDSAPALRVYDSASVLVEELRIPPKDRHNATGLFAHFLTLDGDYAVGDYSWRANWVVNGVAGVAFGIFHVVAGGDENGAIEAHEFIDKRGSTHLIEQLSSEQYVFGNNPRL